MIFTDVLHFWFNDIDSGYWWKKDEAFDQLIRDRFTDIHTKARQCELVSWRHSAEGRLAEILVLDQFSRNMFRGSAEAFAYDALALCLAQHAVKLGVAKDLSAKQRSFLYMPYMHSESPAIHEEALRLYSDPELKNNLDFELKHKRIIDRFGRYPHRNRLLGRPSTAEELTFLKEPGSSF